MRWSRDRVFARTWQWLGDLADVAEPGSLAPRDLLPGLLGAAAAPRPRRPGHVALPVERLHPSREHPRCRPVPGRPYPLRLPLAPLRSRGAHDVHAGVRRCEGLSVPGGRSASTAVLRVGRPRLRSARSGRDLRRCLRRPAAPPRMAFCRTISPRSAARPRLRNRRALGAVYRELPRGLPHPVRPQRP